MFDDAPVREKFDCAVTNRRARTFALALVCVELAVRKDDTRANNFLPGAHGGLLLAAIREIVPDLMIEAGNDPVILECRLHQVEERTIRKLRRRFLESFLRDLVPE